MSSILLVEDDEIVRRTVGETLQHLGHQVVESPNGSHALTQLDAAPFDLAIVDIIMPERDGLETIIALRQRAPALKIIAMSGGGRIASDDYLAIARRLGAHRVLRKPFTTGELLTVLEELGQ